MVQTLIEREIFSPHEGLTREQSWRAGLGRALQAQGPPVIGGATLAVYRAIDVELLMCRHLNH